MAKQRDVKFTANLGRTGRKSAKSLTVAGCDVYTLPLNFSPCRRALRRPGLTCAATERRVEPSMKRYLPFIIVAAVAVLAIGAGAVLYRAKRTAMSSSPPSSAASKTMKPEHVRGEINAPMTLEEFGDFQCPARATVGAMLQPL